MGCDSLPDDEEKIMFKKIKTVMIEQIKMGVTPEKLAQSVLTGIIIGIIPVLGVSTALAALIATKLKLNHIVTQTVNYLVYPVQILMLPVYIKIVSLIFNVGDAPVRPDLIIEQFMASPSTFMMKYGLIGFYALFVWAFLAMVLYLVFYPLILKSIEKFKRGRATWNG